MERLRNEDLCMILIDRGVVEDHLPNHVLDSLVQFKQQCLAQHYREEEVKKLREVGKRERQERREARKKTNTAGAVLVTGFQLNHLLKQFSVLASASM